MLCMVRVAKQWTILLCMVRVARQWNVVHSPCSMTMDHYVVRGPRSEIMNIVSHISRISKRNVISCRHMSVGGNDQRMFCYDVMFTVVLPTSAAQSSPVLSRGTRHCRLHRLWNAQTSRLL